jgi:hypothetical protein
VSEGVSVFSQLVPVNWYVVPSGACLVQPSVLVTGAGSSGVGVAIRDESIGSHANPFHLEYCPFSSYLISPIEGTAGAAGPPPVYLFIKYLPVLRLNLSYISIYILNPIHY